MSWSAAYCQNDMMAKNLTSWEYSWAWWSLQAPHTPTRQIPACSCFLSQSPGGSTQNHQETHWNHKEASAPSLHHTEGNIVSGEPENATKILKYLKNSCGCSYQEWCPERESQSAAILAPACRPGRTEGPSWCSCTACTPKPTYIKFIEHWLEKLRLPPVLSMFLPSWCNPPSGCPVPYSHRPATSRVSVPPPRTLFYLYGYWRIKIWNIIMLKNFLILLLPVLSQNKRSITNI